jgi:hypothetical protein
MHARHMKVKYTPENRGVWQYHSVGYFWAKIPPKTMNCYQLSSGHVIIQCTNRVNLNSGSEKTLSLNIIAKRCGLFTFAALLYTIAEISRIDFSRHAQDICWRQYMFSSFGQQNVYCMPCWLSETSVVFNPLPPKDIYVCRTAPLTSRRWILNIYSTNTIIRTEYFKHVA